MTYAIFSIGSVQYRAEPGVTIKVPLLAGEPGSKLTFDRVLLASDGKHGHTGKPVLRGAKVTADVAPHARGEKTHARRFARRPGIRRRAGHRHPSPNTRTADGKP